MFYDNIFSVIHPRSLINAFVIRSLDLKYHIWTCNQQNFNCLASLCSSEDWFESDFAGNPKDRFCRVGAHYNTTRSILANYLTKISKPIVTFVIISPVDHEKKRKNKNAASILELIMETSVGIFENRPARKGTYQ